MCASFVICFYFISLNPIGICKSLNEIKVYCIIIKESIVSQILGRSYKFLVCTKLEAQRS